jgi:CheY-like chemotaxis protein
MRILIIEDHEDAAVMLKRLLDLDGHEVTLAVSGREGLAAADACAPHLVLCDLGLPGELDGLAVGRALRARIPDAHLVALTGYSDDEHRRLAIAAGFDQHLGKPLRHDELARLCADLSAAAHRHGGPPDVRWFSSP